MEQRFRSRLFFSKATRAFALRTVAALVSAVVLSSCSILGGGSEAETAVDDTGQALDSLVAEAATASGATTATARVPSLREQMKKIADNQIIMQEDIRGIREDVAQVKQELRDLRSLMSERLSQNETQTPAVKGEPLDTVDAESSAILLPDDVAEESATDTAEDNAPQTPSSTRLLAADNAADTASAQPAKPSQSKPAPSQPEKPAPLVLPDDYKTALSYIGKKRYPEAIELLRKVIITESNPIVLANAHYWLGESFFAEKDFLQAIVNLRETLKAKHSTKHDDALLMIAESQVRLENVDEAKKTYQKLIATYPQSEFIPRAKKMLQVL